MTTRPLRATPRPSPRELEGTSRTRVVQFEYRADNGLRRSAYVALPKWYGPRRNPPLPLVISPHGRGGHGRTNLELFGNLPGYGGFAVLSPDGQGRRLDRFSWGYRGQIDDLARMPILVRRAFPWMRIDSRRIYAVGGSMGGQESLLLASFHPRLLAGVAAFDSLVDFPRQYRNFTQLGEYCHARCRANWGDDSLGQALRGLSRREVGGTPAEVPAEYALRSPLAQATRIARSGLLVQIWWSTKDRIVVQPQLQSGALFREIRRVNPAARAVAYVGTWRHTIEMRASHRMPYALAHLGLLPKTFGHMPGGMRRIASPTARGL